MWIEKTKEWQLEAKSREKEGKGKKSKKGKSASDYLAEQEQRLRARAEAAARYPLCKPWSNSSRCSCRFEEQTRAEQEENLLVRIMYQYTHLIDICIHNRCSHDKDFSNMI